MNEEIVINGVIRKGFWDSGAFVVLNEDALYYKESLDCHDLDGEWRVIRRFFSQPIY